MPARSRTRRPRSSTSTSSSAPASARPPAARLLPRPEDQDARGPRHVGVLRRGHAHPDPRRPVLQRHRAAVPEERRRPRQHGRTSCCSGSPASIRSARLVRVGTERFEVVGVFDKRPTPGGFSGNADDFVVIPYTTYQRIFGLRVARVGRPGDDLEHPDLGAAARRRQRQGRDGRRPARHAHPPRPQARRAGRLRHGHAGFDSASSGTRSARRRSSRSSSSRRSR